MRTSNALCTAAAAAFVLAGCAPGAAPAPDLPAGQPAAPAAQLVIADWPDKSQEVARTIIDRYGPPHEATASRLIWHGNGPWKRTVLYREPIQHNFPMPHKDLLEQFIDYDVPPELFDELARYDGSVIVERTKGEMSARCDKEGANFLALNLAHDIVTGQRTVEEARAFYTETIEAVQRGERPAYFQEFQFELPRRGTADPDTSTIRM